MPMSGELRSTPLNNGLIRPLAILLMVIGAAGFVASRILWGEQVLCMFGSTLVVFLGLALILYLRRNNMAAQQHSLRQTAMGTAYAQESDQMEHNHVPLVSMTDFVADNFKRQGGQVFIETRRPERSILRVSMPGGEIYSAIVHEGIDAVDVGELRALLALVSNHHSQTGYYVTDGYFTPRAAEWAADKPLSLVEKGQFDLLNVQ
jgi:hypothetical protein